MDEELVQSLERGAREYQTAVGQNLEGIDGSAVSKRLGGNRLEWKSCCGLVRGIKNKEDSLRE